MSSSATPNQASPQNFHEYFEIWIAKLKQYLSKLIYVTATPHACTPTALIEQVVGHFEELYRVKFDWMQKDVFLLISSRWRTEFEVALDWIGGWRPTSAFHVLYSTSGVQLESWLDDFLSFQGQRSCAPADDLGGLNPGQLYLVNEMKMKIVNEEMEITEKMAEQQETIADMEMIRLTRAFSKYSMHQGMGECDEDDFHELLLKPKKERLVRILGSADQLRITTLKEVTAILTPNQALHFLFAVVEFQLSLHTFGKLFNQKKLKNLARPNIHG